MVVPDWIDSAVRGPAQALSIGILHVTRANNSLDEIALKEVVGISPERRRVGAPSAHSVSVIGISSGSTGTPKLVLITHANLFAVAATMQARFGLSENDRCVCVLPLYSGFALKIELVAPLLIGSSVALPKTQKPDDIAIWSSELNPTWFTATPTFLHAALDKLRATKDQKLVHSLRFFAASSAYLPEELRTGLEMSLGIPGLEYYGSREAGIIAANPAPPAKRKPGSAGLIFPDEVAILDDNGEILPGGSTGAIAVCGQGISPGYLEALPTGRDSIDLPANSSKWLLTGDLGVIDADGFLWVVGRSKEMINRGGEKISPYEIEKVLLSHPSVKEAAAFSVPHPRLGENIAAAAVLKVGAHTRSVELRDFLYEQLPTSKVPGHIFIMPSLPRGQNGKILRTRLVDSVADIVRNIARPKNIIEFEILEVWQRLIGRTDIGVEDDFFEAGGDSLLATHMLLEVEAIIGKRVPESALRRSVTVRRLGRVAEEAVSKQTELVTCARSGAGKPFFFCHGDYTTRGLYASKLADLLGHDRSIFLLHPPHDFDKDAQITIEMMAQAYLPQVLASQPVGSFRLGGHCNGGLIAWEIAHQLEQAGREVESVILIDSPSLNARSSFRAIHRFLHSITFITSEKIGGKIESNVMRALWILAKIIYYIERHGFDKGLKRIHRAIVESEPYALEISARAYYKTVVSYLPPKIKGAVYCLLSEDSWDKQDFSSVPWNHLAGEVHCERIAGKHLTCITTHVAELADLLNRLLSPSEQSSPSRS